MKNLKHVAMSAKTELNLPVAHAAETLAAVITVVPDLYELIRRSFWRVYCIRIYAEYDGSVPAPMKLNAGRTRASLLRVR